MDSDDRFATPRQPNSLELTSTSAVNNANDYLVLFGFFASVTIFFYLLGRWK
jgi:hypothetical protein